MSSSTPHFLWFISNVGCCSIYIHDVYVDWNIPGISYSPKCLLWSTIGFYLVVCTWKARDNRTFVHLGHKHDGMGACLIFYIIVIMRVYTVWISDLKKHNTNVQSPRDAGSLPELPNQRISWYMGSWVYFIQAVLFWTSVRRLGQATNPQCQLYHSRKWHGIYSITRPY